MCRRFKSGPRHSRAARRVSGVYPRMGDPPLSSCGTIHGMLQIGTSSKLPKPARSLVLQLAAIALFVASACGGPTATAPGQVDTLSGRYRVSAGGGTIPLITALTKRFTELHPGVLWDIEHLGADRPIASVDSLEPGAGRLHPHSEGA